jgi:ribosomal protein S18 acetylase RimI-like enzyme
VYHIDKGQRAEPQPEEVSMGGHERELKHNAEEFEYRRPEEDEWPMVRSARLAALRDAPDFLLPGKPPEPRWTERRWRLSWQSGLWLIARAGGRTIGLARLSYLDADAYVESVWTDPRFRHRGVASSLVSRLTRARRPTGDLFVWVIHPNPEAFRLYRRLGFQTTGYRQLLEDFGRVEERLRFTGGDSAA